MKIKIIKNYHDKTDKIYKYDTLDLKPGFSVLIGCNGSGKTTLLEQIESFCKKEGIVYFSFDNYKDGGSTAMSKAGFFGDTDALIHDFISSEGEKINNNICREAGKIGRLVRKTSQQEDKRMFILFDAIDSGLSIDGVIDTKENLFDLILDDCKTFGVEAYIVVSANEFEMANGENCINVVTGEQKVINDYNEYKRIILETYKNKCRRYKFEPHFDVKQRIEECKKLTKK